MSDDLEQIRWSMIRMMCPICIVDYDPSEGDYPSLLGPVGEVDYHVDPSDFHTEDGFDIELYQQRNETEPAMRCNDCGSVFDLRFEPRPESSDAARRLAESREQAERMFRRYGDFDADDEEPEISGVSVIDIYEKYAQDGLEPAEVADELGVALAQVHDAIAYYYHNAEEMRELRFEE